MKALKDTRSIASFYTKKPKLEQINFENTSKLMQLDAVDVQPILTTQQLNSPKLLNKDLCNNKPITLECIEEKEKYLFLDNDPAQFCLIKNLSYELISKILELGLCQPQPEELPEQCYPKRKGHRFIPSLYKKKLPDGSFIKRNWLSYSKSNM